MNVDVADEYGTPLISALDSVDADWRSHARLTAHWSPTEADAETGTAEDWCVTTPLTQEGIPTLNGEAAGQFRFGLLGIGTGFTGMFNRQWGTGFPTEAVAYAACRDVRLTLTVDIAEADDPDRGVGRPYKGCWDLTDLWFRSFSEGPEEVPAGAYVPPDTLRSWMAQVQAQVELLIATHTVGEEETDGELLCMPSAMVSLSMDELRRGLKGARLPDCELLLRVWRSCWNRQMEEADLFGVPFRGWGAWMDSELSDDADEGDYCFVTTGTRSDVRDILARNGLPVKDGLWFAADGSAWLVCGEQAQEIPGEPGDITTVLATDSDVFRSMAPFTRGANFNLLDDREVRS